MFFGKYFWHQSQFVSHFNPGTLAGIITPNLIGPILDHVNLNIPSHDCLTGIDITPVDYRVPFAIADVAFLGRKQLWLHVKIKC